MHAKQSEDNNFFSYYAWRLNRLISVMSGIGDQINVQYNIYLILLRGDRIGYLLVRNEGQQTRIVRMRSWGVHSADDISTRHNTARVLQFWQWYTSILCIQN